VLPGATITTELWRVGADTALFRCTADGRVALDGGEISYAPAVSARL
jgi:hypothetical protein